MPTDTKLKELIINELTEEQYKALTPNDDELYFTPDGSITKNENGSYVLDGDVDITGTTKLNGGIEPIHIYRFRLKNHQYELHVYEEKVWNSGHWYNFFGLLIDEYQRNVEKRYCVGSYYIDYTGDFTDLSIVSSWQRYIYTEKFEIENGTYSKSEFATSKDIPDVSNLQPKLYRHNLVLNGKYWKEYITDSNLKVNTIQDLDTITHAKNGTTLVLGAENQLLLIKQDNTWKIGAETVTTVSDNVTTL